MSCFFIPYANLCLLIGVFKPFPFAVIDMVGLKSTFYFLFSVCSLFFFFHFSFFFLPSCRLLEYILEFYFDLSIMF